MVSDNEVIRVMRDGGLRLVDHAKAQWLSGKYDQPDDPELSHKMRQEHWKRWDEIARRIPELARLLKGVVSNGA